MVLAIDRAREAGTAVPSPLRDTERPSGTSPGGPQLGFGDGSFERPMTVQLSGAAKSVAAAIAGSTRETGMLFRPNATRGQPRPGFAGRYMPGPGAAQDATIVLQWKPKNSWVTYPVM